MVTYYCCGVNQNYLQLSNHYIIITINNYHYYNTVVVETMKASHIYLDVRTRVTEGQKISTTKGCANNQRVNLLYPLATNNLPVVVWALSCSNIWTTKCLGLLRETEFIPNQYCQLLYDNLKLPIFLSEIIPYQQWSQGKLTERT